MFEFVIATKNQKKLEELERILKPMGFGVVKGELPDVEETGETFEKNALLKAFSAFYATNRTPAIADDSGLCVNALDGAPGVYSARFAGEYSTDFDNISLLLKKMEAVTKRSAHFVCVIACVFSEDDFFTVTGKCEGEIAKEPVGNKGFGYDPVFISEKGPFGLLSSEEKDSISHRGMALRELESKLLIRGNKSED